jgi:hypothetical protein
MYNNSSEHTNEQVLVGEWWKIMSTIVILNLNWNPAVLEKYLRCGDKIFLFAGAAARVNGGKSIGVIYKNYYFLLRAIK